MFDGLSAIGAAWRGAIHISEWSGLSVGALAGLGLLAYIEPTTRRLAICCGVLVALGYGAVMYGHRVGAADIQSQWDAAKARAEQVQQEADRNAAASDSTLSSAIEAKWKAQHDQDLAEIAQLKSRTACMFDDGDLAVGGVRAQPRHHQAKPAAGSAAADHKSAAAAPSDDGLLLSLVRRFGLQGIGRAGDASPHGE